MDSTRRPATRAALRRMLSPTLHAVLRARGLQEDLNQEIAAVQHEYRDAGDLVYMRAVQRAVYRFLANEGFRRPRGSPRYDDPVLPFSVALHANSLPVQVRERLLKEVHHA